MRRIAFAVRPATFPNPEMLAGGYSVQDTSGSVVLTVGST
jgi:hypothetical protein